MKTASGSAVHLSSNVSSCPNPGSRHRTPAPPRETRTVPSDVQETAWACLHSLRDRPSRLTPSSLCQPSLRPAPPTARMQLLHSPSRQAPAPPDRHQPHQLTPVQGEEGSTSLQSSPPKGTYSGGTSMSQAGRSHQRCRPDN